MSNSDCTRNVQLAADIHRDRAHNQGTRCASQRMERVVLVDHHSLFNLHQRRLHQILREFPQPGVAFFALHPVHGIVGRLWLSATDQVRAGTIGRHSEVDLHLPHDEELSLRHLLVLVRASPRSERIQVLDLATPGGFQAEQGGVLRAVDANGTLILRAASYSLFFFPTGTPPPWDPDAQDPWLSLPARVVVADERVAAEPRRSRVGRRSPNETSVSVREGPSEPGPAPVREPGEEIEGLLILSTGGAQARLSVGGRALERGVILGRYSRCAGDTAVMSDQVSRVHAMLVRIEGTLHIVDTGSTNGTITGNRAVKCEPIGAGQAYALGRMIVRWEPTH